MYNVHTAIHCTHCTYCTMYTLYKPTDGNQFSCIVYTHSTAKLVSHVAASSRAGPEPPRTLERTINRKPCNAVGGALKPSAASIPLFPGFPGLGGPREATPPREGQSCLGEVPSKTATCPSHHASFMTWLANQSSAIILQTKHEYRAGHCCLTGWSPRVLAPEPTGGKLILNFL